MVDDNPKTQSDYSDTLIMQTASMHDINSNHDAGLKLESLNTISVHKLFSKAISENMVSVHDLTSRGYK